MSEISYIHGASATDYALLKQVGRFVKKSRLKMNITQQQLADDAGISRSTLSLLERGETVTLATFIRVLRVLDLLHLITDTFKVSEQISPVLYAKMNKNQRQRARNSDDDFNIAAEPENIGW